MADPNTDRKSSTTIERRAARQARHGRLLRDCMARADVSQADLAAACGIHPSKVARWLDPDSIERPAAHELEAFPDEVAVDVLREIARLHGYTLAPLPAGVSSADDVQVLAVAMKESAEAVAAGAACIRPGLRPDRALLTRLEREATEGIEAMAALRMRARAELDELDAIPLAARRLGTLGGGGR